MKTRISTCILIRFEPLEKFSESLSSFLDSYFEVISLDYLDNGLQQYVAYVQTSFQEQHFICSAQRAGIKLPKYQIEQLKSENWLKDNAIKFDPIEVADFCIYGFHEQQKPKTKKIQIKIDASTAFGSTHPTTCMCLNALSDLNLLSFQPSKILDVGTGSGILSIAAAKKWHTTQPTVLSIDIDAQSVQKTDENARLNHVSENITAAYSNGFKSEIVSQNAPYDLVFANIFARPLRAMAKDMSRHISPNGYTVVSGFTDEQTTWVKKAYEKHGFKCIKIYQQSYWRAAVFQKKQKITELQSHLKPNEAFWVKRNNMFLSEDVLPIENKILELTNFSGSAGMLLILRDKSFLLVDGRYSIQARKEVFGGIDVIDSQNFMQTLILLLTQNNIKTLFFNPWCVSQDEADFISNENVALKPDDITPSSSISLPQKVFKHPVHFAGLSAQNKAKLIIQAFPNGFDSLLLTSAQEVSWLSNLRAKDLNCSPIFRTFAVLHKSGALKLYRPHQMQTLISDLRNSATVLYNKTQTPFALAQYIKTNTNIAFDILSKTKLHKNPVELQGFIKAHIRDGVAIVKFLHWFEKNNTDLCELDIVQKLHDFRSRGKYYFSESFETIAAIGAHAAIVHYQPTIKSNKFCGRNKILLIDSGAQYFDGTTDITRTIALSKPTKQIKNDFTLVLKAHISLAAHTFKEGTKAYLLDAVCRNVMLAQHKNYEHGTGHSVGHFSNVHEPPFSINAKNQTPVMENYVTSIEPGIYIENAYGIRIENLVYTIKNPQNNELRFEPLTLCPIDLRLINLSLLTDFEKQWLNNYHQKVYQTLKPFLSKSEKAWLKEKCREI